MFAAQRIQCPDHIGRRVEYRAVQIEQYRS
jgi:hypothetical protein